MLHFVHINEYSDVIKSNKIIDLKLTRRNYRERVYSKNLGSIKLLVLQLDNDESLTIEYARFRPSCPVRENVNLEYIIRREFVEGMSKELKLVTSRQET